ncbi:MAG: adenylate/guanylate cyclase domain-containing protein, partial [Saprospiraceae bacterium]|nr:adenylate/guanylate cyclase domain-containing protein [Saprospiraceae bacterium]
MQSELKTYPQVPLRIGIHLGDIHYDETEVYGHGVNVAARIEPVCNPGGIFVSHKVYQEIKNHQWLKAKSLGVYRFKNIEDDLELFAIQDKAVTFPTPADIAMIRQLSQKVNVSVAAERSEAVRRYNVRQKRRRRQMASRWAAIGLIVLLGLVAVWQLSDILVPAGPDDGRMAIAVLPFTNMSSEPDNEYFSDGMTEDILTLLSKIEGLSVTSRTSVMQYKGTRKSTRQIARELNVDRILEGSVRRSGDRVRITAQLIDAETDEHLWAHSYDQKLTDIFDVQSQVAEDIALKLKSKLSPEDRQELQAKPAKNYTAYDIYLKGRKKYREYTAESNEEAINLFYQALEIDPDYAYALAGLGDAYAQKANHNGMNQAYLDTAILMSARAIEADPKLSEGYK